MSAPSAKDLYDACVGRGLCAPDAYEEAARTQRQMAERGERMSLLDVLVISGALPPDNARELRAQGLGSIGFSTPVDVIPEASPRGGAPAPVAAPGHSVAQPGPQRPQFARFPEQRSPPPARPQEPQRAPPARFQEQRFAPQANAPEPASPPPPRFSEQRFPAPENTPDPETPAPPRISEHRFAHPPKPTEPPGGHRPPPARAINPPDDMDCDLTPTPPPARFQEQRSAPPAKPPEQRPAAPPAKYPEPRAAPIGKPLTGDSTMAWSRDQPTAAVVPGLNRKPGNGEGESTLGFDAEDLRGAMGNAAARSDPAGGAVRAATPAPRVVLGRTSVPDDVEAQLAAGAAELVGVPDVTGGAPAAPAEDVPFGSDLGGRTLGGCRLERELGRGAMGVVFEATHLSLQRRVAVKVLMPSARRSEKDVEQFFQEARALARIEHQNIVQVHDVGEQDGLYYIVMQFLEGETLADRLDRVRAFPWEEACKAARDAARGLGVAHGKGIVHRDIKPENVFITAEGVIKIADFGLAAQAAKGDDAPGRTEVMGTPAYMSPEQIDGCNVDGRADLYSLGCTLYVMLTGQKPFEGTTAIEVLLKQTKEIAIPVCKLVPTVPLSVSQVVEKLMAKAPSARYQKAEDLASDLDKILGGGKPKVVVEIEDVMGRMQDLMREAETPHVSVVTRPLVVVTCAMLLVTGLSALLLVALPSVEAPALDTDAIIQEPPESLAAENAAKAALAETEALALKLEDRLDIVMKQYEDLDKRYGRIYGAPIAASKEMAVQRAEKRRDTMIAEARAKALPLVKTDPAAAVELLLAVPDSMRQGGDVAGWAKDLERAMAALRAATGMTFVPAGKAQFGPDRHPTETTAYLIDVSEVSNADYAKFVEGTSGRPPKHWGGILPPSAIRDLPVVGVTAKEADAYAKWVGKRLPSAAEWERSARGTDGTVYPWGDDFDPARCVSRATEGGKLVPVMTYPGGRSPTGAFHMAGNAAEWTTEMATDPILLGRREVRGGSAKAHPSQCTTYVRYWMPEETDDPDLLIGFRCARDVR